MIVKKEPFAHLICENYMTPDEFANCKSAINFNEMKAYCDDPDSFEHDNAQHGNYSMPTDETKHAGWLENYFTNRDTTDKITQALYGQVLTPDHCYVNLHWDCSDTSLGVHNDQKKYRWLVTGQLYVDGHEQDGVILQDDNLKEITQVPLKPNLFYAMATSMYSWHHVKHVKQDKVSVLVRFGKRKINTVTARDDTKEYAIVIVNDNHYDGHYSKLGMRMANITEAWLYNQGYKNIHMSDWKNSESLQRLKQYCDHYYDKTIFVPSGYLGEVDILSTDIDSKHIEIITKDNVEQFAQTIFDRSTYNNTRFRAGEMILKSFDPLATCSETKIVISR